MLKELLDAVAKQAVGAAGPQHKEIDTTKTYIVLNADGKPEFVGNQVPWRKHKAQDLETIAAFADKNKSAAIWYSRTAIVLLVNDADRREHVTVEMIHSDQILKLAELDNGKPPLIGQRELLFMLRTVFTPDALPKFPKLIDTLRQVKFKAGMDTDVNVQRGKSSVGKAVSAEATFQAEVPEQITLSIPVFDNSFARQTHDVICALEIYEAEQKLQLFPLPGEVEKAYAAAEADLSASLRDLLGKSTVPIYLGVP